MNALSPNLLPEEIKVPIQRKEGQEDLAFPCYMTESAAGMDICAAVQDDVVMYPGDRVLIPTGFSIALPEGFEAQIRPRSGLAIHNGVTLLNSPGTIDADYRGEIKIILINHGRDPFTVRRGERIAQMVIHRVSRVVWQVCDQLDDTTRGDGGFGHTNR